VLEGIPSPKTVAELTILMPVSGGSVHEIIGFSSFPPATGQNQTREITVIADSDNKIKETNEENNALTLQGTCPG
jgi:subtilase family serine protease